MTTMQQDFTSLDALNEAMQRQLMPGPGLGRFVPGEGPATAIFAFVGEAPGDAEDRAGRPFVGPAGRLLDRALDAADIDRGMSYMTNAVKQFHFVERGKRRLHAKPGNAEVAAQRPWLWQEIDLVQPVVIVALGATAGLALAERPVGVMRERGPMTFRNRRGYLTVHPSYLLRLPDPEAQRAAFGMFVDELRQIRRIGLPL
ncbi:UdgX family uracil-DNA binding protein [Pleomorphomonas koreensis]|uniref:UdgX family uracil-DNA binding protein n=1 Tax=Pleomorphomonas koreensis TaxID=257440 RepID=UPI00069E884A|nr:UdgX family uracil-DNA binding protein [Pleomorphomonas koreensis]